MTLVEDGDLARADVVAWCLAALDSPGRPSDQKTVADVVAALRVSGAEVPGGLARLQQLLATCHGQVTSVLLPLAIDLLDDRRRRGGAGGHGHVPAGDEAAHRPAAGPDREGHAVAPRRPGRACRAGGAGREHRRSPPGQGGRGPREARRCSADIERLPHRASGSGRPHRPTRARSATASTSSRPSTTTTPSGSSATPCGCRPRHWNPSTNPPRSPWSSAGRGRTARTPSASVSTRTTGCSRHGTSPPGSAGCCATGWTASSTLLRVPAGWLAIAVVPGACSTSGVRPRRWASATSVSHSSAPDGCRSCSAPPPGRTRVSTSTRWSTACGRSADVGFGPLDLLQAILRLRPVDPARAVELEGLPVVPPDLSAGTTTSVTDAVAYVRDAVAAGRFIPPFVTSQRLREEGWLDLDQPPAGFWLAMLPVDPADLGSDVDELALVARPFDFGDDLRHVAPWVPDLALRPAGLWRKPSGRYPIPDRLVDGPGPMGVAVHDALFREYANDLAEARQEAVQTTLRGIGRQTYARMPAITAAAGRLAHGRLNLSRCAQAWEQVFLAGGLRADLDRGAGHREHGGHAAAPASRAVRPAAHADQLRPRGSRGHRAHRARWTVRRWPPRRARPRATRKRGASSPHWRQHDEQSGGDGVPRPVRARREQRARPEPGHRPRPHARRRRVAPDVLHRVRGPARGHGGRVARRRRRRGDEVRRPRPGQAAGQPRPGGHGQRRPAAVRVVLGLQRGLRAVRPPARRHRLRRGRLRHHQRRHQPAAAGRAGVGATR